MLKNRMSEREKREIGEHRGAELSPRQIKAIRREAAEIEEYIEFIKRL